VHDAGKILLHGEDEGVVGREIRELFFEGGSEGGESGGVVLVDEEDEAGLEKHLFGQAGLTGRSEGTVEGVTIGSDHEVLHELVATGRGSGTRAILGVKGKGGEEEEEEEEEVVFHHQKSGPVVRPVRL
jgi:hypothetical protein